MLYLIPPILYKGTSFNDITDGLIASAKKAGLPITVFKIEKKDLRVFGLENPKEYTINAIRKLEFLFNKLKNGDKIIFVDFFCPGLDLIEYYLKRVDFKVEKIALMHGGSFVDGDLYSEFSWLNYFEKGWLDIYDKVIVPSNFFINNFDERQMKKIVVLPWGLNNQIKPKFTQKKFDVVFPHRLASDKGIGELIAIVEQMPNVSFCITNINSKVMEKSPIQIKQWYKKLKVLPNVTLLGVEVESDHLKTLKSSRLVLSTAYQEGFGYAVMKAIQCGNIPILPNRCCYPEFFTNKYLYNNLNEAIELIRKYLKNYPNGYFKLDNKVFNFDRIISNIKLQK